METMYQIRRSRARERELARASAEDAEIREASESTASLMAALTAVTERDARLSQVSYAEVGVHRPDGSRVRPSMDSDRPLLANAAMPGSSHSLGGGHSRSQSNLSYASSTPGTPERRRSDEIFNMGSARPSFQTDAGRISTSDSLRPPDMANIRQMETTEPAPDYEGADWGPPPEYTSPVEVRNRGLDNLPILVVDSGTPGTSRAPTPQPAQR